jgi:hypothetical protein
MTEYSTGVKNMWNQTPYPKEMDHLLRILLRLHLAPEREELFMDKRKEITTGLSKEARSIIAKGKQVAQPPAIPPPVSQTISKNNRRRRRKCLCNELSDNSENHQRINNKRIQGILKQLIKIETPNTSPVASPASNPPSPASNPSSPASNPSSPANNPSSSTASSNPEADLEYDIESALRLDKTLDLDDVEQDNDIEDNSDPNTITPSPTGQAPETSAKRLKILLTILKNILESPTAPSPVTENYVRSMGFRGQSFTTLERQTVVRLANALSPYVPKRIQGQSGKPKAPTPHIALKAPIVIIANQVLRATGYHHFTRLMAPQVSPSSTHALHLGAVGFYEVFSSRHDKKFTVFDVANNPITNNASVTGVPGNKRSVIGGFFDLRKVDSICRNHGLDFADRYVAHMLHKFSYFFLC